MEQLANFKDYVILFYGVNGLNPIKGLTEMDIYKAISILFIERPDLSFEGDSVDREFVRDIILRWRKLA